MILFIISGCKDTIFDKTERNKHIDFDKTERNNHVVFDKTERKLISHSCIHSTDNYLFLTAITLKPMSGDGA